MELLPPSGFDDETLRRLSRYPEELTVDDCAEILGIGRQQVLRYLRAERLFGYKLGKKWRVPRSALRTYVCANRNQPVPPVVSAGAVCSLTETRPVLYGRRATDRLPHTD